MDGVVDHTEYDIENHKSSDERRVHDVSWYRLVTHVEEVVKEAQVGIWIHLILSIGSPFHKTMLDQLVKMVDGNTVAAQV